MRVVHVSAYFAPAFVYGGPPRSIHGLCRALTSAGMDVEVFTTDANGGDAIPPELAASGVYEGVRVRYFPRDWPAEPIGSRALVDALRPALTHADLVHIHGLWNRVVWGAARAAHRAGVPYVLSPRGMLEPAALAHRSIRKRLAWSLVERDTIERAALLHATSDRELETLRAIRPAAEIALVPNGVEVAPCRPRSVRTPTIVFVGRLHPIKRLDLLVDAFVCVRSSGRDARLVIAGPDESGLRTGLTRRAGASAGSIEWRGPVDERGKAALFGEASALVMCSDSESFGLSAAEAMAAGVPVVVTRTCPWADVERHSAGFWVEQRADAIAAALARLIDDPGLAQSMGSRARALIERKYQWCVVAAELARRYEAVLAARLLARGAAS